MEKPTICIHDISTDEVTDREMTDEEFDSYQASKAEELAAAAEEEAKLTAREALLDRLGITADEAKLLLG